MKILYYVAAVMLLVNQAVGQSMNVQPQPGMQGSNNFNNQRQPGMIGTNQRQPGMTGTNQRQPGMAGNNQMQPGMAGNNQMQPGMAGNNQMQPGMTGNNQMQPGMAGNNFNNQPQPGMAGTNQRQPGMTGTNQQPPQLANQNTPAQAGTQPTLSPADRSQMNCAQAGRTAVAQCFQSNGNFQMMTVIALLSNGTQGQLPANPNQVRSSLCQVQSQIFACIFDNIQRFNGSKECSTPAAYLRLEQETVGLLSGVQQMCGTGIMPDITPCVQRVTFDLMQCFEKTGLNPDLYSPRASRMEGAIIGDNREVARVFCGKRKELFACQKRVMDSCPNARLFQQMNGADQFSQHNGMDVLCNDIDVYVKGLVCFQSPTPNVQTCANNMVQDMTGVTLKQLRDNLSTDAFFSEYCKIRLENLRCDISAWSNSCDLAAVGLKAEYQCQLLPDQCRNNTALSDAYRRACAESKFQRQLRADDNKGENGKNGSGGLVAMGTTVFSLAAFLIMML